MSMFWDAHVSFSLQAWQNQERVLHVDVNQRSGADKWLSDVLDECREGNLQLEDNQKFLDVVVIRCFEDNYNFLHGYPTRLPITFWFEQRQVNDGRHTTPTCRYTPYHVLDDWDDWPEGNECYNCWLERKRRARVLYVDTRAVHAQG
eukprot:2240928-Karenia_brevis.AAC.1